MDLSGQISIEPSDDSVAIHHFQVADFQGKMIIRIGDLAISLHAVQNYEINIMCLKEFLVTVVERG